MSSQAWYFFAFLPVPGLLLSLLGGYLVRRLAVRFGWTDKPGGRKIHSRAVPIGGGVAIWAAICIVFLAAYLLAAGMSQGRAWAEWIGSAVLPADLQVHLAGFCVQSPKLWLVLGLGTVLMLLGLADDLFDLHWLVRLAVQFVVATLAVVAGWRMTLFIHTPIITGPFSVLWIVALINAFNMLDNMDGLSAGVAAIAAAILAIIVLLAGDPVTNQPQLFVGGYFLVIAGALLGFLFHNWAPARLFMGDAGSYLVGFLIAIGTISATFTGPGMPPHAVLAPVFLMAVPFYDMFSVIIIRLRAGRSPFQADANHLSHRLVRLGLSQKHAVMTIYLMTTICGMAGLLLHQLSLTGALIDFALVLCVLVLVAILEYAAAKTASTIRFETQNH